MQLLLIRHAIAEDREEFARTGADDDERPITAFGRQRMIRNARGLRRVLPRISSLASSPLRRARQTAAIVADAYGLESISETGALRPGAAMEAAVEWLEGCAPDALVAGVGHDPHLGTLATWLMSGVAEPRILMKKGGAVLLDLGATPGPGSATLQWAIAPAQLRRLGE